MVMLFHYPPTLTVAESYRYTFKCFAYMYSVPSHVNEIYTFLVSIQRVLEHCADPKTQEIVMDEVLQAVCMLAQDQYGNYVVQVQYRFATL